MFSGQALNYLHGHQRGQSIGLHAATGSNLGNLLGWPQAVLRHLHTAFTLADPLAGIEDWKYPSPYWNIEKSSLYFPIKKFFLSLFTFKFQVFNVDMSNCPFSSLNFFIQMKNNQLINHVFPERKFYNFSQKIKQKGDTKRSVRFSHGNELIRPEAEWSLYKSGLLGRFIEIIILTGV